TGQRLHRSYRPRAATRRGVHAGSCVALRLRDADLPPLDDLDQASSRARARDAHASRRAARRRAACRRFGAAAWQRTTAHSHHHRLPDSDVPRHPRRAQPAPVPAARRVVEVGIGSGLNVPFYRRNVNQVVGLEPSPKLLAMVHKAARQSQIPLRLIEGTAEAIPIEDRNIDTVVTTWTMCSIPDVERALQE